ncbi:MAG TPA: hypothetical protein VF284_06745 [Rhodanobacteraceae bacterium]
MSTPNAFKTLSMTLAAAAVCVSLQAHATTINAPLDFTTNQSVWGPNGNPFHYSDSASYDFPIIGNQNFGYSVGANTGNVSGSVNGTLATTYSSVLSAPGTTSIGLGYSGDPIGGVLKTSVGVGAVWNCSGRRSDPASP